MDIRHKEPMPIMEALDLLWRTLAAGAPAVGGPWFTPAGGYVEVTWLSRKGTYRFTVDLMPPGTKRPDQMGPVAPTNDGAK